MHQATEVKEQFVSLFKRAFFSVAFSGFGAGVCMMGGLLSALIGNLFFSVLMSAYGCYLVWNVVRMRRLFLKFIEGGLRIKEDE